MPSIYYRKNKEKLQKRLGKGITTFLKQRKTKSVNMHVKLIKICLKKKKNKKREYCLERYKNLSEDKKKKTR